jgi:transposase
LGGDPFAGTFQMKSIAEFDNIYLCREFVDFRKSINGLSAIVAADLSLDLKKSSLFIFTNKRRTHMKMLYFDKSGFAIWFKRLEEAKFPWPRDIHKKVVDISSQDLQLLLDGVNVWTRFENVYFESVV